MTLKCSGAKLGMPGKVTGSSMNSVSPTLTSVALTRPTTSPGNASSMVSRSWPNTWWAYLVAKGLPVGWWVTTMPRSNRPEQTRRKAMRSRWDGSMLACTLNTNPENGESSGRGTPSTSGRGAGAGNRSTTASSSLRTPKLVSAEPNSTGVASAARKALTSSSPTVPSSRSTSAAAVVPRRALLGRGPLGVDQLLGRLGGAAGDAGEAGELVGAPVDHAAEVAGDADRPGDGDRGRGRSAARSRRAARAASRPGRSHLLMKVSRGRPRWRQTSNSLSVWGSMPLAASSTMTAASAAASTR